MLFDDHIVIPQKHFVDDPLDLKNKMLKIHLYWSASSLLIISINYVVVLVNF